MNRGRRRVLNAAALLASRHLNAGAAAWVTAAGALSACASTKGEAALTQVADGAWMLPGSGGEVGPGNRGRIGNLSVVAGPDGLIAIDSGVSRRHGEAFLAAIDRATRLPVRALVLTHVRQEFVFGAAAFQDRGIPVHMHRDAARLMAGRCENCLRLLKEQLGEEEMSGTRVVTPDHLFDDASLPDLAAGRLQLWSRGLTSGPGDTAALHRPSGTLITGGLADNRYIPDVQDSDLRAWHEALHRLQQLEPRRIIPGHGPLAEPELLVTVDRYLNELDQAATRLANAGTALSDVADATDLPEFSSWDQYETIHRRNASVAFLRRERALMLR